MKRATSLFLQKADLELQNIFFKTIEAVKLWNGLTCDGVSCSSMEYSSKC